MEQFQFDILIETLTMIEENTRKEDYSASASAAPQSPPILSFLDEAVNQIQKIFFDKLNAKTGWGRNEIKHAFIESIGSVRTSTVEEELPWQQ